jgi:hypothetical protein
VTNEAVCETNHRFALNNHNTTFDPVQQTWVGKRTETERAKAENTKQQHCRNGKATPHHETLPELTSNTHRSPPNFSRIALLPPHTVSGICRQHRASNTSVRRHTRDRRTAGEHNLERRPNREFQTEKPKQSKDQIWFGRSEHSMFGNHDGIYLVRRVAVHGGQFVVGRSRGTEAFRSRPVSS